MGERELVMGERELVMGDMILITSLRWAAPAWEVAEVLLEPAESCNLPDALSSSFSLSSRLRSRCNNNNSLSNHLSITTSTNNKST
jgi:hypothetical protein